MCLKICRECFYEVFEEEIHQVIVENQLFKPGERIAIGASGGKGEHGLLSVNEYFCSVEGELKGLLDGNKGKTA